MLTLASAVSQLSGFGVATTLVRAGSDGVAVEKRGISPFGRLAGRPPL